jgi:hypothetical protein
MSRSKANRGVHLHAFSVFINIIYSKNDFVNPWSSLSVAPHREQCDRDQRNDPDHKTEAGAKCAATAV